MAYRYGVQQMKMPDPVFNVLILVLLVMGMIALVVLLHAIWHWLTPIRKVYGMQSPIYKKNKTNPHQWLIDIAQRDAENPHGELKLISKTVTKWDLKDATHRPWIEIAFKFFNGGVHPVLLGKSKGRPLYNGDQLLDEVESMGTLVLERGQTEDVKIKHHDGANKGSNRKIFAQEVSVEVARSFRRIRSLNLSGVAIDIQSKPKGGYTGATIPMNLGTDDTILVGDTN